MDLPLEGEYRIKGDGLQDSSDFHLDGPAGRRVVLKISPGSKSGVALGGTTMGVGGVVSYFGMLMISGREDYGNRGQIAAGTAVGLAGVAIAGVGAAILYSNWRTDVSQIVAPETGTLARVGAAKRAASLRAGNPNVRTAAQLSGGPVYNSQYPLRPPVTVPFSVSF
jgi:hypothetical protein